MGRSDMLRMAWRGLASPCLTPLLTVFGNVRVLYEEWHTDMKSVKNYKFLFPTPRHAVPRAVNFTAQTCIILQASLLHSHNMTWRHMPYLPTPSMCSCKVMCFWVVTYTSYGAARLDVVSVPSVSTLTRPSPLPAGCTILVVGVAIGRQAQFDEFRDPEQFDLATRTTQPSSRRAWKCPSLPSASSRSCRMQPADKH